MIKDYINLFFEFIRVYGFVFILNIIFSLIIIFVDRKKPVSTLLWVMAINFLPIIGFAFYLILGQDLSRLRLFDKKSRVAKKMNQIARDQLNDLRARKLKLKYKTYEYAEIIQMFNTAEDEIIYSNNDVKKYINGKEMFADLFEDMRSAKEAIYIQSYIFKSDTLSTHIMEILKEKSKAGIECILLVDGMGARAFKNKYRKDLKNNGVKVEVFFPGLFRTINTRINFRNHRKIYIIDHKIGYLGGFNIGDEYISKNKKFGFWRDTHLRITGDAVRGLQYRFFLDYKLASGRTDGKFITLLPEVMGENAQKKEICIVTSGPESRVDSIRNGYEKMITRARKRVLIQTPYFVPDEGLLNSLKVAALSGCDVRIMIPKKKDHLFVHWASLSFIGELLSYGARGYFYNEGFLHSKVVTCDDYISSVGTANFDIRSFELNFEVNAFIFDEELNRSLVEDFYEDMVNSTEITLRWYENRSSLVKFKEGISRLLTPIL